jgi:hypothetical protein
MMSRFLRHLLTEADNETWDLFRVCFSLAFLLFLGLSALVSWHTKTFDGLSFATAFAALFASGTAGVGVKSRLEGPATNGGK